MINLVRALRAANKLPRKLFGFDSFQGLPASEEPLAQECWKEGGFNAQTLFGVQGVDAAVDATERKLRPHCQDLHLHFVPGFFRDVLTDDAPTKYDMLPAVYLDVDVDLYESTVTVLDFFFRHRLIVPGTVIGYDDWGGTPLWTAGESRAHLEMCQKYRVHAEKIVQVGHAFPHIQTAFRILSVGVLNDF